MYSFSKSSLYNRWEGLINLSLITDDLIKQIKNRAWAISKDNLQYTEYAQDALTKILEKENEFDPALSAFNTWATKIAINTIINSVKSNGATRPREIKWAKKNYPDVRRDKRHIVNTDNGETIRTNSAPAPVSLIDQDEAEKVYPCRTITP